MKFKALQMKRRFITANNIVASAPTLLKLLMALISKEQKYVSRPEAMAELEVLEERYLALYPKKRAQRKVAA